MSKTILLIIVLFGLSFSVMSQSITPQVISSGGGDTTKVNVGMSWTIGEPVIKRISSPNTTITQGFHQNHFEIISIEEHPELGFDIKVYPNPATEYINIDLSFTGNDQGLQQTKFLLELLDNVGEVLLRESMENSAQHTISMKDYAQGQYYIRIISADGELHHSVQITKLK